MKVKLTSFPFRVRSDQQWHFCFVCKNRTLQEFYVRITAAILLKLYLSINNFLNKRCFIQINFSFHFALIIIRVR